MLSQVREGLQANLTTLLSILFINKKAMPSQGEPRDASVNFDTYRILQQVDNVMFIR